MRTSVTANKYNINSYYRFHNHIIRGIRRLRGPIFRKRSKEIEEKYA
jgi:hypothetical protein